MSSAFATALEVDRRRIRRFNIALLTIAAVTVLCLIAASAFTMWRVVQVADSTRAQVRQSAEAQRDLQRILAEQLAQKGVADARARQAVEELIRNNQQALDRHDARVAARLQQLADELGQLEQPPRTIVLTATPAPTASRKVAPSPSPTCPRLPNGKCRH